MKQDTAMTLRVFERTEAAVCHKILVEIAADEADTLPAECLHRRLKFGGRAQEVYVNRRHRHRAAAMRKLDDRVVLDLP